MFSFKFILGILAIGIAYYYNLHDLNKLSDDEEEKRLIVEAWQGLVSVPKAKFSRICVGLVTTDCTSQHVCMYVWVAALQRVKYHPSETCYRLLGY